MKTEIFIAATLGASLAMLSQANAGEKELNKNQVPKAVIETFEKAHPNATSVEFEEETFEGKAAYEVEYEENDKEYEFLYSPDGSLVQREEEIDAKMLPEPIVQAITKAYPKAAIKEAEKMMKPDGTLTAYEVEIEEAGKEIELELDLGGKILKAEQD
jgi:uncharacterized membrane protein YkoI